MTKLEEELMQYDGEDISKAILKIRKELLRLHSYYNQMIDMCETMSENYNEMLSRDSCRLFHQFSGRMSRILANAQNLREYSLQIRELYQTQIQMRQNKVMQLLTVVTTIFMPLTLLTGWYGMNFDRMPELHWEFGYAVVIGISVILVIVEIWYFKKRAGFYKKKKIFALLWKNPSIFCIIIIYIWNLQERGRGKMQNQNLLQILDSLDDTGVYVIEKATRTLLYYNQTVKDIRPDIVLGMTCEQVWGGICNDCPLPADDASCPRRIFRYSEIMGQMVSVSAGEMQWDDTTPAYVVTVTPHKWGAEEKQGLEQIEKNVHAESRDRIRRVHYCKSDKRLLCKLSKGYAVDGYTGEGTVWH